VRIGGIGGVATRDDRRRRGLAREAISSAIGALNTGGAAFTLLLCEPRHAALYEKLGWHAFDREVFAVQSGRRIRFEITHPYVFDVKIAPRNGVLDLCGLPW